MLEVPESRDVCQRKLHTGSGTSSRETSILQAAKPEGENHVGPLTLDVHGAAGVGGFLCWVLALL